MPLPTCHTRNEWSELALTTRLFGSTATADTYTMGYRVGCRHGAHTVLILCTCVDLSSVATKHPQTLGCVDIPNAQVVVGARCDDDALVLAIRHYHDTLHHKRNRWRKAATSVATPQGCCSYRGGSGGSLSRQQGKRARGSSIRAGSRAAPRQHQ